MHLAVSNWLNDGPNDVGADWVDIATIRPTQVGGAASLQLIKPQNSVMNRITAPIPSISERAVFVTASRFVV